MKFFLICLLTLLPILLHGEDNEKNRIRFEPGAKEPTSSATSTNPESTPSPSPVATPLFHTQKLAGDPSHPDGTPIPRKIYHSDKTDPLDAMIDVFYQALMAGDIENAYNNLVEKSPVADDPRQVQELKTKTASAIDLYGPITDYELIDQKSVGQRLVRRTYLSHGDTQPLRWRLYFYRIGKDWRLVDFRVDNGLFELFENDSSSRRQ